MTVRICKALESRGYMIWIDIERMQGSIMVRDAIPATATLTLTPVRHMYLLDCQLFCCD